ncbi:flagellar basal-body MS-ring/collar protein FliF [uncultured Litoreibacter sp.]|uniref:flagellar basal-body MS-ring/collar protein FliF n=1 Tax=uncultured Litoreibacter sp. TaxID=1392394 RepID=UPI002629E66B|nr:flagellar basal-body MS-ring/collar protein FliF [uncultured Litoreibacter sp.]
MQQFQDIWTALDGRKRVTVIGSAVLVMLGVLFLTRVAATPNMGLLFSGLAPNAAGEIIEQLEGQGVEFEVKGGAIYVDESRRDQLRLTLAGAGLPANGGDGYELLDELSGFGTTSQMFDAAYLRAKEGELARTIVANPQISAARVHIAQSSQSPFRRSAQPTASVSIRGDGGNIQNGTAEAIRFLVASAVSGLQPEDVSIINADLGVIIAHAGAETPVRTALAHGDRLKKNVERLMLARTGVGGAVVEVNVDTLTDEEVIVERKVDPESRVAISTNTQESSSSSKNQGGGGVTVASNLPEGGGQGNGEQSGQDSDTREIVNYEISETTREVRRVAGSIKRITVAVLVGGTKRVDDSGTEVWEPRSEEELLALEALIKSAVGFDEERGDSVTLRSMDLSPDPALAESPENGWVTSRPLDVIGLTQIGVAAAVVLALGLFVLRPILMSASTQRPPLNELPPVDLLAGPQSAPALPNNSSSNADAPALTSGALTASQSGQSVTTLPAQIEDPTERLKALIDERQDETVEVLKSWIEEPEVALQ